MLPRDEYVEQAYFFKSLLERLEDNQPVQESFRLLQEEVLSTTNLPIAIGYMLGELRLSGCFGPAMENLGHYFSAYQTYLVQSAEREAGRFDMRVALRILQFLAEFHATELSEHGEDKLPALFLFQFEVLCRNRLGYEAGLDAMAADPMYPSEWSDWIKQVRRQIGLLGLAEMIYVRSRHYLRRRDPVELPDGHVLLFGEKEGKISLANRKKDPLLLFAALQRQLDYPQVPRQEKADTSHETIPLMIRRMERLEQRIKLLEEEQQGGVIDLAQFYKGQQ